MTSCRHSLIVTTIHPLNDAMRVLADGAKDSNWLFVVVGDVKTPTHSALEGVDYLSLKSQRAGDLSLGKLLPTCHYARKNIGYLHAIHQGAGIIVETDDDNVPRNEFWHPREKGSKACGILGDGWINIYRAFTSENIWPRGFPLEEILKKTEIGVENTPAGVHCCIQQGLVDGDADVDAIYRLAIGEDITFAQQTAVRITANQRCPFNSQNTSWWPDAWLFLYLPSYCSFRMTDIWRSFIAQSYLLRNGYTIGFHSPTVWQNRNVHDLLRDFSDETPGYLNNGKIMKELDTIPASIEPEEFLRRAYTVLIALGVVGEREISLLDAWMEDISMVMKP